MVVYPSSWIIQINKLWLLAQVENNDRNNGILYFIVQEEKIMNKQGQEKFLHYILERVQEGKEEEAKELLMENFRKQDEGTFSLTEIQEFIPKMIHLLKPDKLEEVQTVVNNFSSEFKKK